MAASVPRIERSFSPVSPTTSRSLRMIAPVVTAVSGRRPMIDFAVTVLPLPLSPTMASTSPESTDRLTPSTATTEPPSVANVMSRLLISTTRVT